MKKYCFLVHCSTHSDDLSGKLAILTTDKLRVNTVEQHDASQFIPGLWVYSSQLGGGSCVVILVANLRLAGYDEKAHSEHMKAIADLPPNWLTPEQFVEVKEIYRLTHN
jgi:hypothetical protein